MSDGHCGAQSNLNLPCKLVPDSSICQTQGRPLTCSRQRQAYYRSRGRIPGTDGDVIDRSSVLLLQGPAFVEEHVRTKRVRTLKKKGGVIYSKPLTQFRDSDLGTLKPTGGPNQGQPALTGPSHLVMNKQRGLWVLFDVREDCLISASWP